MVITASETYGGNKRPLANAASIAQTPGVRPTSKDYEKAVV